MMPVGPWSSRPGREAPAPGRRGVGQRDVPDRPRSWPIQRPAPPSTTAVAARAPAAISTPRRRVGRVRPAGTTRRRRAGRSGWPRLASRRSARVEPPQRRHGRRQPATTPGSDVDDARRPAGVSGGAGDRDQQDSRAAPSAKRRRARARRSRPAPARRRTPSRSGSACRCVPNCAIAHSLIGVGVRSMTVEPTASTGEEAGSSSAATRWPAATPTRVASTPNAA